MQQASATAARPPVGVRGQEDLREWVAKLEAELERLKSRAGGRRKGTLRILLERELARKRAALQALPSLRVVR